MWVAMRGLDVCGNTVKMKKRNAASKAMKSIETAILEEMRMLSRIKKLRAYQNLYICTNGPLRKGIKYLREEYTIILRVLGFEKWNKIFARKENTIILRKFILIPPGERKSCSKRRSTVG